MSFNAKTPGRKGRKDLREKRKLFAAGLDCGDFLEVGREMVGIEGFDLEREEAEGGETKVEGAAGPIDEHGDADGLSLMLANDIECFLNAPAFGDDVFDD